MKNLKEIISTRVGSVYLLDAVVYMFQNNRPLTNKEIWNNMNKDFLKGVESKRPKGTFATLIRRYSDNKEINKPDHWVDKPENWYFHMIQNSSPQSFILRPEFRTEIENLIEDEKEQEEFVYGIKEEGTDMYKIGRTANLEKRIGRIQTGNPRKLNYVFQTPGGKDFENWLHDKIFKDYRQEGEWFELNEENFLQAVIPILKKVYELEKALLRK